jgi:RHS repeat-associated protein
MVEPGKVLFRQEDHLGSTNVVTDSASQPVQLLQYSPYGSVITNTGPVDLAHKFTGHRQDATGLVFMGARYYDPSLGRFVTADPTIQRMGDPQDLNRYSYARNNPLKYTDPTGYGWFKKFWKAVVAAALAVASIFLWAIPGGQPLAAVTTAATLKVATAAAAATLVLDTGEGRQFQGRLAKEVFDDAFGMRPRAAAFTAGMVSHTVVSSAFYVGLTTAFPESSPNMNFSDPANQKSIGQYRSGVRDAHQPGGSTANFIRTHSGRAEFLQQGVIASDSAFQDTPLIGTLFRSIDASTRGDKFAAGFS